MKHHIMKTYGEEEVNFHVFLVSAPDGDERKASKSYSFTAYRLGKSRQYSLNSRLD
jgi:hypothetical protein